MELNFCSPMHVFVAWCVMKHRDSFTFYLISIKLGQYQNVSLCEISRVYVIQRKKESTLTEGNISFLDFGLVVPCIIHFRYSKRLYKDNI